MKVICAECQALNGQLTAVVKAPHPQLQLVTRENWSRLSSGWAKGSIQNYQCQVCGSNLTGDFDTKDSHARWELV